LLACVVLGCSNAEMLCRTPVAKPAVTKHRHRWGLAALLCPVDLVPGIRRLVGNSRNCLPTYCVRCEGAATNQAVDPARRIVERAHEVDRQAATPPHSHVDSIRASSGSAEECVGRPREGTGAEHSARASLLKPAPCRRASEYYAACIRKDKGRSAGIDSGSLQVEVPSSQAPPKYVLHMSSPSPPHLAGPAGRAANHCTPPVATGRTPASRPASGNPAHPRPRQL
jgi:hypothetical protein